MIETVCLALWVWGKNRLLPLPISQAAVCGYRIADLWFFLILVLVLSTDVSQTAVCLLPFFAELVFRALCKEGARLRVALLDWA